MPAQHSTDGGHSLGPFWMACRLMISGCELWGHNALRFKNVSMQQVLVLLQPTAIVKSLGNGPSYLEASKPWVLLLPSLATPLMRLSL